MINEVDMQNIIEESFLQYSGAVLQSRALVDVRDCLKPSARQIFYCLYTDKFLPNKPFKKTLKAVGSASRMYIHGDSSCVGVIMHAGQDFSMRYPLIEVEGNAGTYLKSGNWAASRYTSSRLSFCGVNLFTDIQKNTISEWRDNYDDTEQYPTVLPSKGFYNIVNGTMGIGIGMASSIPQFNLKEVNKALEYLLLHPDCDFEKIYCAPDFATGAILFNEDEVKESLRTGQGKSCKLRSIITYNEKENCLIVTELPFSVYTKTICEELKALIESDDNPGIETYKDLTKETPNIEIYLKPRANQDFVLRRLYKDTSLQYYFGINMTMLDNGRYPKVFTWKEALQAHIDHEKTIYRNSFNYDRAQYQHRVHIIDGLIVCIADIDNVIQKIKSSASSAAAKQVLMADYILDEEQAKAVLATRLSTLAKLEVQELKNEREDLLNKIAAIDEIKFNNCLIQGWREVANKYGDERRTRLIKFADEDSVDDEIKFVEPEKCVVILTESGLIKRVAADSFKPQARGGKGIKNEDSIISMVIRTNTVDNLMIFSDKGKMYRLLVDRIPEGTNATKGVPVTSLVQMDIDETPTIIYSIYRDTDAKYVLFVTQQGLVKKTALEEYINSGKRGLKGVAATKLRDDDGLATVCLVKDEPIVMTTANGMVIKFSSTDIAPTGRISMGVKGITLNADDYVVSAMPVHHAEDNLAVFAAAGYGKQTPLSEFPLQARAGKGTIGYRLTEKADSVIATALLDKDDNVLITGLKTSICLAAKDIPVQGRNTSGALLLKGGNITSVSKV